MLNSNVWLMLLNVSKCQSHFPALSPFDWTRRWGRCTCIDKKRKKGFESHKYNTCFHGKIKSCKNIPKFLNIFKNIFN